MTKFESRIPLGLLMAGLVVSLVNVYAAFGRAAGEPVLWATLDIAAALALVVVFANATVNRSRRPVVEIRDGVVTYGSVFQAVQKRANVSEISQVVPGQPGEVALQMESGRTRTVSLFEVASDLRDAAVTALSGRNHTPARMIWRS